MSDIIALVRSYPATPAHLKTNQFNLE